MENSESKQKATRTSPNRAEGECHDRNIEAFEDRKGSPLQDVDEDVAKLGVRECHGQNSKASEVRKKNAGPTFIERTLRTPWYLQEFGSS